MQETIRKIKKTVDRFIWFITPRFYFCRDVTVIYWLNFEFILQNRE